MPRLIKNGAVVEDEWQVVGLDAELTDAELPGGKVVVPLQYWKANAQILAERSDKFGVWLNSDELAEELGESAAQLDLIALHFPGFMDGRGFSTARLLRERYGFAGELRAIGNIMRDQLCYMRRCGFNSFVLPVGSDLDSAMSSLQDFTEYYQPGSDQPLPLFQRRNTG